MNWSVQRILLAAATAFLLASATLGFTSPAAAEPAQDEWYFHNKINELRNSVGQPSLTTNQELATQARSWSESMAASDHLSHAADLSKGISADWRVLGENVGVHSVHDLDSLFQAFVDSPEHYQNMIDPRFTMVGIGGNARRKRQSVDNAKVYESRK